MSLSTLSLSKYSEETVFIEDTGNLTLPNPNTALLDISSAFETID